MKKAVDPIKELKRELAALTKKVATLEKQLAKADKCCDVTCRSLTVVDSQGKTVASIDGKGNVFGRTVWVAPSAHSTTLPPQLSNRREPGNLRLPNVAQRRGTGTA